MQATYTLHEGYDDGNADPHYFKFELDREHVSNSNNVIDFHIMMKDAEQWCVEQFGESCAGSGWYRYGPYFHFGYEIWASAFKLRWA